jgi:hypothetical protein
MDEVIKVDYAHIPRGSWETFPTEEGKFQLRINIQYEQQNIAKQRVNLGNACGELYKEYVQDKPFTLQQILDYLRIDTKELIVKAKKQKSGYDINLA